MEGKWFADSFDGAVAHGEALSPGGGYRLIEADVPDDAPSLYRLPNAAATDRRSAGLPLTTHWSDSPWPPPADWSLVVEQDEASSEPLRWLADIHYLVAEAPHDSLRPGWPFELYEGSRCVARGEILPASAGLVPLPSLPNSMTHPTEIDAVPSRA